MVIIWTSTDNLLIMIKVTSPMQLWGHRGHDRMVVGFTTTCAISAYHH
jgi:hypothetical protein